MSKRESRGEFRIWHTAEERKPVLMSKPRPGGAMTLMWATQIQIYLATFLSCMLSLIPKDKQHFFISLHLITDMYNIQ